MSDLGMKMKLFFTFLYGNIIGACISKALLVGDWGYYVFLSACAGFGLLWFLKVVK